MRIFGCTTGADTAGINYAIHAAFGRHAPDWDVRAMVASQNYIGYPVDVPWSQIGLERLYDGAEAVHTHNTTHAHRWYDNGQGKPIVLMHHGMHSLGDYAANVADGRAIGAYQVGSTLDLSIIEPAVTWLPAPANLPMLRAIRAAHYRPSNVLRIGHAPTNRGIKGSAAFDAAVAALRNRGRRVEAVLIEGVPWAECLRRKATVDVFFDQPVLGYGSNAIEAWAMGIPVVSGVADPAIRQGMIDTWGRLPFYEADERTLESALNALAIGAELRAEYSALGTAHVERWHDERRTVAQLQSIYGVVGPSAPGGSERRLSAASVAKIQRHEARDARRQREAVR